MRRVESVAAIMVWVCVGCEPAASDSSIDAPAAAKDAAVSDARHDTAPPADVGGQDALAQPLPDAAGADPWDVTVSLKLGGATTPVNLSDLEKTTFDGLEAVRLVRAIEVLALESPWDYHYSPVAADGFKPLDAKLDGDLGALPYYAELESGFFVFDEGALALAWDPALGLPKSLGVKGMAGGVIEVVEIATTGVIVQAGEARTLVDVSVLGSFHGRRRGLQAPRGWTQADGAADRCARRGRCRGCESLRVPVRGQRRVHDPPRELDAVCEPGARLHRERREADRGSLPRRTGTRTSAAGGSRTRCSSMG